MSGHSLIMRRDVGVVVLAVLAAGCTASHPIAPTPTAGLPSYISGRMLTVDPVSGRVGPLTIGSVVIRGATAVTSRVDGTGRFRVAVKPGTYLVTGSVAVAQPQFRCDRKGAVSVSSGATVTVDVLCPSDAG